MAEPQPSTTAPLPDPPRSDTDLVLWSQRLTAALVAIFRKQAGRPGYIRSRRLHAFDGPLLVAGDVALSGGWGATTAAGMVLAGNDQRGNVTLTPAGGGYAANATITVTFRDGPWPQIPFALVVRNDAVLPAGIVTWATTTTTLVITFSGLPVAGNVYTFAWSILG